uniref:Chemokine interleukin-8-like domain-containing protein n=1 Tax=Leptobrachium leishanense TaxID=445787 RepID=A0A8C5QNC8_9ANUR
MKVSLTALSILILVSCSCIHASPHIPTSCCFSYSSKQPVFKNIDRYFHTSSMCAKPAVIFVTTRNNAVCANPKQTWVQKTIERLNKRTPRL